MLPPFRAANVACEHAHSYFKKAAATAAGAGVNASATDFNRPHRSSSCMASYLAQKDVTTSRGTTCTALQCAHGCAQIGSDRSAAASVAIVVVGSICLAVAAAVVVIAVVGRGSGQASATAATKLTRQSHTALTAQLCGALTVVDAPRERIGATLHSGHHGTPLVSSQALPNACPSYRGCATAYTARNDTMHLHQVCALS